MLVALLVLVDLEAVLGFEAYRPGPLWPSRFRWESQAQDLSIHQKQILSPVQAPARHPKGLSQTLRLYPCIPKVLVRHPKDLSQTL